MPQPLTVPVDGRPLCPRCLGGPMGRHGADRGRRRFRCKLCGAVRTEGPGRWWLGPCDRLVRTPSGWVVRHGAEGFRISRDSRGRRRVQLEKVHPWANTGGWLYLYQFLVADELGAPPIAGEQVHHKNGKLDDDRIENLEVLAITYHGRLHATALTIAGLRAADGRFVEHDHGELREHPVPRWGAILGQAARELQRRDLRRRA